MYLSIVAWDLTDSEQTVESLRAYVRDYAVTAFSQLEGMRLKTWFSNSARQVWGAVYLWDSMENMDGPAHVSRAIELIGYPPTSFSVFEVEAATEGISANTDLSAIGRAIKPWSQ